MPKTCFIAGRAPQTIIALTAALARNGVSLWALDAQNVLHCRSQSNWKVGNDWSEWSDEWNAPDKLSRMCAETSWDGTTSRMGGRLFWGVSKDGKKLYNALATVDGKPLWKEWSGVNHPDRTEIITRLTTSIGGDGRMSLWALTADRVLHVRSQIPGGWGDWGKWDTPGPGDASKLELTDICAAQGALTSLRAFWGIGKRGLYWTYETGVAQWTPWETFPDPEGTVESLIAVKWWRMSGVAPPTTNSGFALWACSNNGLYNNIQGRDGKWPGWQPTTIKRKP
jgi:hypothetical protein